MTAKMTLEEIEALVSGVSLDGWEACEPNGRGNGVLVRGAEAWFGRAAWSDETKATARFVANAPRLLEIAQEQAAMIKQYKKAINGWESFVDQLVDAGVIERPKRIGTKK